jgi:hypothetical protein
VDRHPGFAGVLLRVLPAAQRGIHTERGGPPWPDICSELRTGGQRDAPRDCEARAGAPGSGARKATEDVLGQLRRELRVRYYHDHLTAGGGQVHRDDAIGESHNVREQSCEDRVKISHPS